MVKRRGKGIAILIVFFIIVVAALPLYFNSELYAMHSLDKQLDIVASQKDSAVIKKIATSKSAYDFMMNLPKGSKCENTSGMQGMNQNGDYYYVTVLNGRDLGVYMKRSGKGLWGKLFPSLSVSNIETY